MKKRFEGFLELTTGGVRHLIRQLHPLTLARWLNFAEEDRIRERLRPAMTPKGWDYFTGDPPMLYQEQIDGGHHPLDMWQDDQDRVLAMVDYLTRSGEIGPAPCPGVYDWGVEQPADPDEEWLWYRHRAEEDGCPLAALALGDLVHLGMYGHWPEDAEKSQDEVANEWYELALPHDTVRQRTWLRHGMASGTLTHLWGAGARSRSFIGLHVGVHLDPDYPGAADHWTTYQLVFEVMTSNEIEIALRLLDELNDVPPEIVASAREKLRGRYAISGAEPGPTHDEIMLSIERVLKSPDRRSFDDFQPVPDDPAEIWPEFVDLSEMIAWRIGRDGVFTAFHGADLLNLPPDISLVGRRATDTVFTSELRIDVPEGEDDEQLRLQAEWHAMALTEVPGGPVGRDIYDLIEHHDDVPFEIRSPFLTDGVKYWVTCNIRGRDYHDRGFRLDDGTPAYFKVRLVAMAFAGADGQWAGSYGVGRFIGPEQLAERTNKALDHRIKMLQLLSSELHGGRNIDRTLADLPKLAALATGADSVWLLGYENTEVDKMHPEGLREINLASSGDAMSEMPPGFEQAVAAGLVYRDGRVFSGRDEAAGRDMMGAAAREMGMLVVAFPPGPDRGPRERADYKNPEAQHLRDMLGDIASHAGIFLRRYYMETGRADLVARLAGC